MSFTKSAVVVSYLFPNVLELLYPFCNFFQTSVYFAWRERSKPSVHDGMGWDRATLSETDTHANMGLIQQKYAKEMYAIHLASSN